MSDSFCVECGPSVRVDEDGCCASCGASAMGPWADSAASAVAEVPRLKQRIARLRGAIRLEMKGACAAGEFRSPVLFDALAADTRAARKAGRK